MNFHPDLIRTLSKEELEAFTESFKQGEEFRLRLAQVIMGKLNTLRKQQVSPDYEKPAWAEYQADCNGAIRTFSVILNYLQTTEKRGN